MKLKPEIKKELEQRINDKLETVIKQKLESQLKDQLEPEVKEISAKLQREKQNFRSDRIRTHEWHKLSLESCT